MKKFIFSILTFILLGSTLCGGVFLLAGCDYSQSQEENNQENGNNSDSENGNNVSDGENDINNEDNPEDQAINSDHDVHVVSFFRTSNSAVYQSSENMDNNTYPRDIFHISWHDTGGGNTEWGFSTIHSNVGINGEADYTYNTFDASYFTYSFTGPIFSNQKRYAEIEPQNENGYVYVGWTYSSSKGSPTAWSSNSDYRSSIGVDHIYKYNRSASNTKPSSSDNNNQGTVSLYYRKQFSSYFYCNGGRFSSGQTSRTLYYLAGVSFTLPEAPTRVGYTFGGWHETSNTNETCVWSANYVFLDDWASGDKTFVATWIPNTYNVTLNANGGSVSTTSSMRTFEISDLSSENWVDYNCGQNITASFSSSNNYSTLTINGQGGWEIIGIPIYFANTSLSYTLSFWYQVTSSYTPLSGYSGLRIQLLTSLPADTDNASIERAGTNLPTYASSGTKTITFTPGQSVLYLCINGGYVNDGSIYNIFRFRDFEVSQSSYKVATYNSAYGTLPTPTKTGYTFNGWYTSSSGGTQVTSSTIVSQTSSHTLYAHWTANTYTNRYNYRTTSGSSTTSISQTRTYGQSFTTYTTSSVSEYVSNGWSLYGWATSSSTYSRNYGVGVSVSDYNSSTSTVNLYAISSRTISLSYNANGGTNAPSSFSSTQYWNQVGNAYNLTTITISSSVPKRDGYSFLGWSTSSTATTATYKAGNSYSFTYSTANAVTLYAVWQANTYYVKFNGNNATSGSMSNQTFTYDKAQNLTANAFSRTGYTFAGWATSASGSVVYTDKQSVKNLTTSNGATVNLYAKWNVVSYTITYDENGGNTVSDLSYTIESASTLTSTTRTGYTFNGWKPKISVGSWSSNTTYNAGESVTGKYGDVELVAQWTAYKYTVVFDKNSTYATGTMNNQSFTYDTNQNLTANAFKNDGFTFKGWNTESDGTGTTYSDNESVKNLTTTNNGTVTLYAIWQANLEAKYDSAGGYWYVELGMYPQTRATQTEINSINTSSNGNSYVINGKSYTAKKGANNTEFVQYNGVWFKVEPIKWRLTGNSSQKVGYGTSTDTMAIMDTIVYAGQFSTSNLGIDQGYNNRATTSFENLVKNADNSTYLVAYNPVVENFGENGVISETAQTSDKIYISSEEEIQLVAGSYEVKFSDLVIDMLGITIYFTRDMGTNINNITCRTEYGGPTQKFATSVQGFQFTIKVSEYGCVS